MGEVAEGVAPSFAGSPSPIAHHISVPVVRSGPEKLAVGEVKRM